MRYQYLVRSDVIYKTENMFYWITCLLSHHRLVCFYWTARRFFNADCKAVQAFCHIFVMGISVFAQGLYGIWRQINPDIVKSHGTLSGKNCQISNYRRRNICGYLAVGLWHHHVIDFRWTLIKVMALWHAVQSHYMRQWSYILNWPSETPFTWNKTSNGRFKCSFLNSIVDFI